MKFIDTYSKNLSLKTEDEVFKYLVTNVKETIKGWDYFVNWNKALGNIKNIELQLNILNYLIGKEDLETELKYLLEKYPEVLIVAPIVIASRDKEIKVLEPSENNIFNYKNFNFRKKKKLTAEEIDNAVEFLSKSGFLELFRNKTIKNVVDYTLGVEVGLDTNGRKNRTGTAMEGVVELFVKKMCDKHGYEYIAQATVSKIQEKWGINVPTDKNDRHFDFAVNNGTKLFLIETNYFSGGGSKLKSVAGEFKELYSLVKGQDISFCWITDGLGWDTAKAPLRETFNSTDYIFNLTMVEQGALEHIVINNL